MTDKQPRKIFLKPLGTATAQTSGALPPERELYWFLVAVRKQLGLEYCSPPQLGVCTDCSGLVAYAYLQATGRTIPGGGGSHEQYNSAGRLLKRQEPWLPGDLLFYDTMGVSRAGNRASHVGVYLGNGLAIHAMNEDMDIQELPTNTAYWNKRFLGARRLWEVTTPGPDPQPVPDEPVPVTAAAAPITPQIAAPVAFSTPARAIKAVGAGEWASILKAADSPMVGEAANIAKAVGPLLTLAGAMSYKESQYGKEAAAPFNPLGLMELNGSTLKRFTSWSAAFRDWWSRITDAAYKGGVYMPREMTLEQYIVTYVGGPGCWSSKGATCANGETWRPGGGPNTGSINLYLYQTKARINRYLGHYDPDPLWPDFDDGEPDPVTPTGYTGWKVEGASQRLYLPKHLAFKTQLTPAWRTCNRSGRAIQLTGLRCHETGNTRVGTNAQMHATWQFNGTEGHPDGCVAVHGYVDDHQYIQTLPFNEQGIHSGDFGNQQHISTERCVNSDSDRRKSFENMAHVQAGLCFMFGLTPEEHMWMHHESSGCPPGLRSAWGEFERLVRTNLNAIKSSV